jgi:hypothetical protein
MKKYAETFDEDLKKTVPIITPQDMTDLIDAVIEMDTKHAFEDLAALYYMRGYLHGCESVGALIELERCHGDTMAYENVFAMIRLAMDHWSDGLGVENLEQEWKGLYPRLEALEAEYNERRGALDMGFADNPCNPYERREVE